MKNLALSEKYALAAVILLAALVLINRPLVTLPGAIVGIAAGVWVGQRDKLSRAAILALVGFALGAVFAVITLLR